MPQEIEEVSDNQESNDGSQTQIIARMRVMKAPEGNHDDGQTEVRHTQDVPAQPLEQFHR